MIYLGLDPGTSTGWACSDGTSGVRKCRAVPSRLTHAALLRERFADFQWWLSDLLTETGAAVVVCEASGTTGASGGQHFAGASVKPQFLAVIGATCGIREVCLEVVNPSTWQAWAKRHHGWTREDKGDEADARAILAWGLANVQPEVSS